MHTLATLERHLFWAKVKHLAMIEKLQHFKGFLATDKFVGVDSNGDRKDWISTADVANFIDDLISDS